MLGRTIALNPTLAQRKHLRRAAGVARFAWNWGKAWWDERRRLAMAEEDLKRRRALMPTLERMKADWAEVRRTEYPWTLGVTKCAGTQALIDLAETYARAAKELAAAKRERRRPRCMLGFPRYKSKRRSTPSFALWNDQLALRTVRGRAEVRIPNLGWVKLREDVPGLGGLLGARVRFSRGRWRLSLQFDLGWADGEMSDTAARIAQAKARKRAVAEGMDPEVAKATIAVASDRPERLAPLHPRFGLVAGVDGGVAAHATVRVEDAKGRVLAGSKAKPPRRWRSLKKRLALAQRRFAKGLRRKRKSWLVTKANSKTKRVHEPFAKGERPILSNRDRKRLERVRRLEWKAADGRADDQHKLTTAIARSAGLVVGEFLHLPGLMRNHSLAGALADASLGEQARQLGYKCAREGGLFLRAPRFFPSSKRCSSCGAVLADLDLKVRDWACPACGARHDRDGNAAANLAWLGRLVAMDDEGAAFRLAREADPNGRIGLVEWLFEGRAAYAALLENRSKALAAFAPGPDEAEASPGSDEAGASPRAGGATAGVRGDGTALAGVRKDPGSTGLATPGALRPGNGSANQAVTGDADAHP